ncbi:MAG: hypothetical protein KGH50_02325 [Candidatus Micrarchaeota archaeon]|nr:hypothetical protein [Candidatus Micrarchaeota archaeon]
MFAIIYSLTYYTTLHTNPVITSTAPTTYTTIAISATNVTINASEELNNSLKEGFAFNYSVFAANSASECELVRISQCWNNAPSQAVCINRAYGAAYREQSSSIRNSTGPIVCAMYYELGNMSCTVAANYCVLVDMT